MTDCTSHFIFSLADKYQISIDNSKPSEFLDENYYGFCQEYLEQCTTRDINLKRHLTDNPNLFRTFLPWRPYIFDTVLQLQWYYDELVIYDPVYFEINNFKTGNIENDKSELRQLLSFLALLKDSINEGFLLFGSYDTFLTSNKQIEDNKFENLLSVPELRYECDKLVQVYKMESEEGKEKSYFNIRANYRNKDAAVFYVGARKNNYIAKIAYDANTSSLKDVSKYRGAFEISFTYLGKKSKSKEIRHCPRL